MRSSVGGTWTLIQGGAMEALEHEGGQHQGGEPEHAALPSRLLVGDLGPDGAMGVVHQEKGSNTAAGCHEPAAALDGHAHR